MQKIMCCLLEKITFLFHGSIFKGESIHNLHHFQWTASDFDQLIAYYCKALVGFRKGPRRTKDGGINLSLTDTEISQFEFRQLH